MPADAFPLRCYLSHEPKAGNTETEYEDAVAVLPGRGRFAIADGASESSFAGRWAELLVNGFLANPWKRGQDEGWLRPLRETWAEEVDHLSLPWYAEEKRAEGAYATFLGLVLKRRRWLALAAGDCCIFRVRDGKLLRPFPLHDSSVFGNRPDLLGSRPTASAPPMLRVAGRWQPGDRFFLMTDALAQWFLQSCEHGERPWEYLAPVYDDGQGFRRWVNSARERGNLRNDDVTLLTIEL